jgi:AcrR family transcriptional regulator
MRAQLGREDWVRAAIAALARGGVEAVRVEPLARRLRVTKGSFYWHFRDRPELLNALLDTWEARGTLAVIERVESLGGGPEQRLWRLFEIVVREGQGAGEHAIRTWARTDPAAAEVLRRVDARRIQYLEGLFRQLGFAEEEAQARARLVYCALVGEWAMGVPASLDRRLHLARLNHRILTARP